MPPLETLNSYIQPVRNKEKMKTDSDWSKSEGKILNSGKWKLEDS
jgi:hypothetical protein